MTLPLNKLAPVAAVLAVLGYLCWPYFGDAATPDQSTPKTARISVELLSPTVAPASDRDPFRLLDEPAPPRPTMAKATMHVPPSTVPSTAGPVTSKPPQPAPPQAAAVKPLEQKPVASAVAVTEPPAPRPVPGLTGEDLTGRLRLEATSVRGTSRLAMINGATYSEGDRIEWQDDVDHEVMVERIMLDRVLVRHAGQSFELGFETPGAKSKQKATSTGRAPSRPASTSTQRKAG